MFHLRVVFWHIRENVGVNGTGARNRCRTAGLPDAGLSDAALHSDPQGCPGGGKDSGEGHNKSGTHASLIAGALPLALVRCEQSEQTSKAIAGDFARLLAERWREEEATFARLLAEPWREGRPLCSFARKGKGRTPKA